MSALASYLRRALALARRGEGHTRPNPPVGAVLVKDGRIVAEGFHRRAGGDHAEVAALKNAARRRVSPRGATLVVTLEPCSTAGRVGACTDAIIAAGVREVVYAIDDPNRVNRQRAVRVLGRAGIPCWCVENKLRSRARPWDAAETAELQSLVGEIRSLMAPFAKFTRTALPFVTVKLAMSLDGRICDTAGKARWISSAASRRLTGSWREKVDAILVGGETVRRDNPSLLSHGRRNDDLIRVVVSRSGKLPKDAQVFTDGKNETLVFRDPLVALRELGRRGCLHVLCEGGLKLATSLAEQGLVDAWCQITAPLVIGSRPLGEALRLHPVKVWTPDRLQGDTATLYAKA